ncbi:unnamed protein product [Brassica oleracea]
MPVFSMNVFQLPASLCAEIDSILSGFWWGTKNGKRKMSYISWKKLAISKSNGGLGFRDLRLFNQALLANQLWKISRRPQSLIYRIFKHRYFSRSSIWNAKLGYQPSYGWKSLMYGRELLNQGMQINIGNGLTTLLSDNWLPTKPPRAPVLLPYTNPTLTVNTLINPETNQWDNEIISDLIEQQDHCLIQQQFLSGLQPEDTKIWSHTKDGNYSVKSGYYSTIGTSENLPEVSPPLASHPDIAKQIWKTETQPKLKLFLWRLFSGALAIKSTLRRRHINVDPSCVRCCNIDETPEHLFFHCPFAQSVWRLSGFPCTKILDLSISMEDKFRDLLCITQNRQLDPLLRSRPIWTLWRLWKCRNELIFNSKVWSPGGLHSKVTDDLVDWHRFNQIPTTPTGCTSITTTDQALKSWQLPPADWVKCNYDVSHHHGRQESGMGWIIRNKFGIVLDCGMGRFEGRSTVEEGECTALIWAIQAAYSLGYKKVIFEGDNIQVTRCLQTASINLRLENYLKTISAWKSHFHNIRFMYRSRSANSCSDLLAKKSLTSDNAWSVFHTCPPFLYNNVMTDLLI